MKKHYREENDCLNCGAVLQGKYCHTCGQENLQIKESFSHMMNHAISDYFHFDHQFFHTLKPLFFKPGYLTNEYMSGRRAQFLHPVKMYIFISVVYFLLFFKSGGGNDIVHINQNAKPAKNGIVISPVGDKELDSTKKVIASSNFIPNAAKKELENDIDEQKKADKNKAHVEVTDYGKTPNSWFHPSTKDTSYESYLVNQKKLPENEQDDFLIRTWNKKVFNYREKYGNGAREEFVDNLEHNAPKMMFLLLPLFALILRVAFWKNKKFYVEYLIYTFHLFCFLFLFLGVIMLLKMLIPVHSEAFYGWVALVEIICITWYIYRSLRVVYRRSRFRTITKMIGIGFMYTLAFSGCITLLFIVTTVI